ncbi:transketolase [Patescibacteria group bacterium]|nr:transketolase [Patescibacteria group bacterium]MBU1721243.1 transketolase [Patescibacteria group bacterium]MBU1901049.1 transketolase [Patescibacteria group bacterium]
MNTELSPQSEQLVSIFAKACRGSIVSMVTNAQSGHPGGSLSCIDYLSLLYTQIIVETKETVVISNGHVSPAVYATLAEMGTLNKQEVIEGFRQFGSIYEGHVTRHVPGISYGTGPLAIGASAATGFALAAKKNRSNKRVFVLIGDGEAQEGQMYEMMNFASKQHLNNLIVFMDYNQVQLSGALADIIPIDYAGLFNNAGWHVLEVNGHNYQEMWQALETSTTSTDKPTIIIGHTIMGKGVELMEKDGNAHKSNWHGKAPTPDQAKEMLKALTLSNEEQKILSAWKETIPYKPSKTEKITVDVGTAQNYPVGEMVDCRSAYGNALLDLAQKNKHIIALTADVASSVKTKSVQDALPEQHIDCGIAEQHMISCAGGLSLDGYIPFCSTFGVFMTSRAKDQARVNDINNTNVKMVATHCGLSVGEDGPTHQAIDDVTSFLGLYNTKIIEPADANHCDRIIRYIAQTPGNIYVRMGRHTLPILQKEDGSPYFDSKYQYTYGACELLRTGSDITIAATGSTVAEAMLAYELLKKERISAEIIIVSAPKVFDNTLYNSVKKTKKIITVEDHNALAGYGTQIMQALRQQNISITASHILGTKTYALSGTQEELYKEAEIDASGIVATVKKLIIS